VAADEWYLEADFTVRCFTPLWYWYTAPIVLWLLLYGAGIPVAVFVLPYRYRHQAWITFVFASVFCVISLGLLVVKVANRFELSRRLCGECLQQQQQQQQSGTNTDREAEPLLPSSASSVK